MGTIWNLFRLYWWRLVFDVIRFNLFATDIVHERHESRPFSASLGQDSIREKADHSQKSSHLESIGEYVSRKGYSPQFLKHYLVPMVASPWCIDPTSFAQEFPAVFLIEFM